MRGESFAGFIPELERLITEAMDEWKIPGLAIAVVQNGEVALRRACGLRDVEAGAPANRTPSALLHGDSPCAFPHR